MFQNSTRPLGVGLMLAALLPLSHGSQLLSAQRTFISESTETQARVVEHAPKLPAPGVKPGNEVYSVVEFSDDNGIRRVARANVASYPPPHDIGDEIRVRVHQTRADDVRVASFTGLWFESSFYLIPGLLTLLGGVLLFCKRRKHNPSPS